MSQNLQGITFGFFESLPEEAKFYVEDILYGSKASKAKPELPWEDELETDNISEALSKSVEVSVCAENAPPEVSLCTSNTPVEAVVNTANLQNEHAAPIVQHSPTEAETRPCPEEAPVSMAPELSPGCDFPSGGDIGTLPAPPGIHQPMYTIPVVTAIPSHMIPMVGVYHHQSGMPINYMPLMPHQGIPMMPPPQDQVLSATAQPDDLHGPRDDEMYINNNDKFADNKDKEANKILGGKTYERRNKKRRPANYYENLERQKPAVGLEMQPDMYNSNVNMVNPLYPLPGQLAHYTPQDHVKSMQADYCGREMSSNQVVLMSPSAQCTHYVGQMPAYIQPSAPAHILGDGIVITPEVIQNQHMDTQSNIPPEMPPMEPTHTTNTSLSSEIYTDGRRTYKNQFSFGDVQEELDAIDQKNKLKQEMNVNDSKQNLDNPEPNMDGADQNIDNAEENVSHSVVLKLSEMNDSSGDVKQGDVCPTSPVGTDSVESCPTTHDLCLQPSCDSSVTVTIELPCVDNASSEVPVSDKTNPPTCAHDNDSPVQCAASQQVQKKTETNMNQNNALPEIELKPNETMPPSPHEAERPPPVKTTSWASLFSSSNTAAAATVIYNQSSGPISEDKLVPKKDMEKLPETVTANKDKVVKQLGALLKDYTPRYKSVSLQPRGLVNRGNWCYVNATLQALLACPAFYNLIKYLPSYPALDRGPSSTPVLDSIVELVNEFSPMPPIKPMEKNNKGKGNIKYDLPTGPTFEPTYVYKMLQVMKYDGFKGGRQEDAEEFLSCLLNGLHDEMVAAMKIEQAKTQDGENEVTEVTTNGNGELSQDDLSQDGEIDDAGWEQVGPKNKSVVTRSTTVDKSPVSAIFQGQIRNILNRPGMRESATLQPFFTLQLEIQSENVRTVQEALDNLVSKEMLQDFTCSKTKMEVDASRRTMLEQLPAVLLLHLKCFVYDKNGGCQKVVKQLDFTNVLDIHKDLISPTGRNQFPASQRKYKLFAVIKHVGVRAAGGHYVADVFHKNLGEWVHYDDNNVHVVTMPQVFMFRHPRVPYLLFYRRDDLR